MTAEVMWLLGAAMTIALAVLGFFWRYLDKQFDRINQRIADGETVTEQATRDLRLEQEKLRREIYRDFVRRDDHDKLAQTIRTDFQLVFSHLNEISSAVNRMIGRHQIKDGALEQEGP